MATAGVVGPTEPLPAPAQPPLPQQPAGPDRRAQVLEDFLASMVKVDTDAFFWEPVSLSDAPLYFDIIKRPMDIQTMRNKARAGEYQSWTAFVTDFEQMCQNALVYNQKRSRVHRTATAMLRQGRKQLQDMEGAGIRAILSLNPNAVAHQPVAPLANVAPPLAAAQPAAAAAAAAAAAGPGSHKPPPKPPLKAPPLKAPQKAAVRSPIKPQAPRKGPPPKKSRLAAKLLSGGRHSTLADAAATAAAALPEAAWSDGEDIQADLEEPACCSSFSEAEGEAGPALQSTADGPAQAPSPAALAAPSEAAPASSAGQPSTDSRSQAADGAPGEAAALWRSRRKGAEWRAHWLELRLADLQHQSQQYAAQLAALRSSPAEQQAQLDAQSRPQPVQTAAAAVAGPASMDSGGAAQQASAPAALPAAGGKAPAVQLQVLPVRCSPAPAVTVEPQKPVQQGKTPEARQVDIQAFPAAQQSVLQPSAAPLVPAAAVGTSQAPIAAASATAAVAQLPMDTPSLAAAVPVPQPSLPTSAVLDSGQPPASCFEPQQQQQQASAPAPGSQRLLPVVTAQPAEPGLSGSGAGSLLEERQDLLLAEQDQLGQAASGPAPDGRRRAYKRKARTEVAEFAPGALLRHPFFAAHAGVQRSSQVVLETEPSGQTALPNAPVAIHASLEWLDQQVDILKRKVLQVPHSDHVASKGHRGLGRSGRSRARQPPQKRLRPLNVATSFDRHPSRRRLEEEGLFGLSTPRGTERLLVADIKTPAVRQLTSRELEHRSSGIAFFRSSSGMEGLSRGPSRGPSNLAALVAELGPEPELAADLLAEGSSSEDTSDAFYQDLHRQHETQEHIQFGLRNGGGAKKKPPSQGSLKHALDAQAQRQVQLPHASSAPPSVAAALGPPPSLPPVPEGAPVVGQASASAVSSALMQSLPAAAHPNGKTLPPLALSVSMAAKPNGVPQPGSPSRPRGRPPGGARGRGRGSGRAGRPAGQRGRGRSGGAPDAALKGRNGDRAPVQPNGVIV